VVAPSAQNGHVYGMNLKGLYLLHVMMDVGLGWRIWKIVKVRSVHLRNFVIIVKRQVVDFVLRKKGKTSLKLVMK